MSRNIYFMGIGGTGMASVAGLLKEAGFHVTGSDAGVYPPMSDVLKDGGISYKTPYDPGNLKGERIDEIVVANVLSRGHEELEEAITMKLKLTSFPAVLEEKILPSRSPIVISGTHGKTTTTTLATHVLRELGYDPGYIIGGLPRNFEKGYHLGEHELFLLEGDEYDTAYFDKESKFLHYCPEFLILNNLEFDHADKFENLDEIEKAFSKLIALVDDKTKIIANYDDQGIAKLVRALDLEKNVRKVAGLGLAKQAEFAVKDYKFDEKAHLWNVTIQTPLGDWDLQTGLSGPHNMSNLSMVIGLCFSLAETGKIKPFDQKDMFNAVSSFKGVARRLDYLGDAQGVIVYEDFAHHPTSVDLVLKSLKQMYPQKRLVAAFEPKNATSRRNVFLDDFARSLSNADCVLVGECPADARISSDQKMDTAKLSQKISSDSHSFASNQQLLDYAITHTAANDVLVFMSPGSFSGIQHRFLEQKKSSNA